MRGWIVGVVVVVMVAAGCHREVVKRASPVGRGSGGLVWETPMSPWVVTYGVGAIAIDGTTALVGGEHGRIARMDLTTGVIVETTDVGVNDKITSIARLPDRRWVVATDGLRVLTLEAHDLAPRIVPVTFADTGTYELELAVLPDGRVVITGPGRALQAYDATTWQPGETFAEELGWRDLRIVGSTVTAWRDNRMTRVDVVTKAREELTWQQVVLDELHVPVGELAYAFAIDPSGRWGIASHENRVGIYDLTTRRRLHDVPLETPGQRAAVFAFDDDRVLFAMSNVLRVVSLGTGVTSPYPRKLFPTSDIAISDDAEVTAFGFGAWRFDGGGRVVVHDRWGRGRARAIARNGQRYVVGFDDAGTPTLELWELGRASPLAMWRHAARPIVFDGSAVVLRTPEGLVRVDEDAATPTIPLHHDATLLGVSGGEAIIGEARDISLVDLQSWRHRPSTVAFPGCHGAVRAATNPTTTRVALFDGSTVALWERRDATLSSVARFEGPIEDVIVLPGEALLVRTRNAVLYWVPGKHLRGFANPDVTEIAASPNGQLLAALFRDGRLQVYDLRHLVFVMSERPVPGTAPPCREDRR